jgi:hypothetical protein
MEEELVKVVRLDAIPHRRGRVHLTKRRGFLSTREIATLCGLRIRAKRATRRNADGLDNCVMCQVPVDPRRKR